MLNMVLFGVGIALLCGIGLLFAHNATEHSKNRHKANEGQ